VSKQSIVENIKREYFEAKQLRRIPQGNDTNSTKFILFCLTTCILAITFASGKAACVFSSKPSRNPPLGAGAGAGGGGGASLAALSGRLKSTISTALPFFFFELLRLSARHRMELD
jgi:hypothetical protein